MDESVYDMGQSGQCRAGCVGSRHSFYNKFVYILSIMVHPMLNLHLIHTHTHRNHRLDCKLFSPWCWSRCHSFFFFDLFFSILPPNWPPACQINFRVSSDCMWVAQFAHRLGRKVRKMVMVGVGGRGTSTVEVADS